LSTAATVKKAVEQSIPAFKLFEFLFGNLPFKTISVVQQPTRDSSRGWPNMIVVPYTYFLDSTIKNQLGMLESGEQREFQLTVAIQEMAHQWLEHLVGGKTYRDQWLWDGGADFACLMYLRQFEPSELDSFRDIRRKWLLSKNSLGYRPVDAGPVWLNSQLDEYNAETNSVYVNRYKGSYIMEMIRVLMYNSKLTNPDGRFIVMMRDFTSTYAGQNASTQDFQRVVEKHVGISMQWFFDQWVYGSETPAYDFSYRLSDAEDGHTKLSMSITQSGVSDSFRMQLPLYVVINGERRYLGLLDVAGTKPLNTDLTLRVRPDKVILDPDRSILAEINQ
jgi:aminopeptidase N